MSLNLKDEIYKLKFALDNVSAYIYIKDLDSKYIYANETTLKLFGCDSKSLVGKDDNSFFPEDTIKRLREIDLRVLDGNETEEEVIVKDKEGKLTIYLEKKKPIYENDNTGKVIGILGISADITERKLLENKLLKFAMSDDLTGIANRRFIVEEIDRSIKRAKRSNQIGALLFIDLNKFKKLNDEHGHEIGDKVLIKTAKYLTETLRETDTPARMGGDEFVVLLENLGLNKDLVEQEVKNIITKIHNSFKNKLIFENISYEISASIGYSLFFGNEKSVDEILKKADKSMYQSKLRVKD